MENEIVLGCLAKDTVTGFTGIVNTKTEWLNGCVRYGLQPRELHEGKLIESQCFDREQVEYVGPGLNISPKARPTGGDRPNPGRARDPR